MGKIFEYDNKSSGQVLPDLDYLIITNGAEEYNISITEFFNVHLGRTSHDHSTYTIESQVRDYARQESTIITVNAISVHETTWNHNDFVDSAEAGNIADTHIAGYFPLTTTNLQNGDTLSYNSTSLRWENGTASEIGWSGTFTSVDNKLITVTNGIIVSAVELSIWFDYTIDEANSGEDGTGYYNENGVAGWTFTEQV